MRHSIMACIGPALESEKEQIDILVREAVERFDFAHEIQKTVYSEISNQINQALKSAMVRAFASPEVDAEFTRLAQAQVKSMLERMQQ